MRRPQTPLLPPSDARIERMRRSWDTGETGSPPGSSFPISYWSLGQYCPPSSVLLVCFMVLSPILLLQGPDFSPDPAAPLLLFPPI